MSNTTATSTAYKPVAQSSQGAQLLREMFQATPLYIFVSAMKSAFGKR